MNTERLKSSKMVQLLPWLLLFLFFTLFVYFQLTNGEAYLDSDMASEMVLAKQMNDSGSFLFEKDWYYSTEVRVISQQIPFRIGLLLFPSDWHCARVFGQAVILLAYALSFIYMMSGIGLRQLGVWGAAALMLPFGYWYLFHCIYDGLYLPYLLMLTLSVGIIIRIANVTRFPGRVRQWIRLGILAVYCVAQGMVGIRMLMNLYIPLVLAAFLLLALRINQQPLTRSCLTRDWHVRLLFASVFAAFFSLVGYVINSTILCELYSFPSASNRLWQPFSIERLGTVFSMFLSIFGYPHSGSLSINGWPEIELFSMRGLLFAASIVLMLALVFIIFRLFKLWNQLPKPHQFIFALFVSCLVVDGVAYACLQDIDTVLGYYWLPIVPLAFASVLIWLENEQFRMRAFANAVGAFLLACLLCTSFANGKQFLSAPHLAPANIQPVVQWLSDHDYRAGYATFWYSNIITEHTDGQIEMWTLANQGDPLLQPWMQKISHWTPPEGQFFILLAQNYYDTHIDSLPPFLQNGQVAYNQDGYTILVYDDASQLNP